MDRVASWQQVAKIMQENKDKLVWNKLEVAAKLDILSDSRLTRRFYAVIGTMLRAGALVKVPDSKRSGCDAKFSLAEHMYDPAVLLLTNIPLPPVKGNQTMTSENEKALTERVNVLEKQVTSFRESVSGLFHLQDLLKESVEQPATNFPNFGNRPAQGKPIFGAARADLDFYIDKAIKDIVSPDPTKFQWRAREVNRLIAYHTEIRRQAAEKHTNGSATSPL